MTPTEYSFPWIFFKITRLAFDDGVAYTVMKKTVLHSEHLLQKAKMVDFAGYDMPVQYSGVIQEHLCVRQNVGIFDVSHMGWLSIKGPQVCSKINPLFTKDLSKLSTGSALYSLMCLESGGTVDDLILYKESEESVFVVLNASNKEKDLLHMTNHLKNSPEITFEPLFDQVAIIAIQGPKACELIKALGCPLEYQFMKFGTWNFQDHPTYLAFTGYTGERGAEWIVPSSIAKTAWNELLNHGQRLGIMPCGLAARDTLRTEMGYSLYGHELSETISPVSAGLNWAISWSKDNFIGKEALSKERVSPSKKLVSLKSSSKRAARANSPILDSVGQECGHVTSGTFSPSLGYSIAMALVNNDSDGPYYVPFREDKLLFEITQRPFYTNPKK